MIKDPSGFIPEVNEIERHTRFMRSQWVDSAMCSIWGAIWNANVQQANKQAVPLEAGCALTARIGVTDRFG